LRFFNKIKYHGYNASDIKDLPKAIFDPIAIFKDSGTGGTHRILTELKIKDENVLVSIGIGKGGEINFNTIYSVFGKSRDSVIFWLGNGSLLYFNKAKAPDYLHTTPHQSREQINNQGLTGNQP